MSIRELMGEVQRLIDRTPFTREEIAALWQAEEGREWEPETIVAMAAAYEYLHKTGDPKAELLRAKYLNLRRELEEKYASPLS